MKYRKTNFEKNLWLFTVLTITVNTLWAFTAFYFHLHFALYTSTLTLITTLLLLTGGFVSSKYDSLTSSAKLGLLIGLFSFAWNRFMIIYIFVTLRPPPPAYIGYDILFTIIAGFISSLISGGIGLIGGGMWWFYSRLLSKRTD